MVGTHVSVPQQLLAPLVVPKRLLLGPGPSNMPPEVVAALSMPLLGYLHQEFLDVSRHLSSPSIRGSSYSFVLNNGQTLKPTYVFQTRNRVTLAISGTGHSGMEASFVNLVEPGDKVVVAQQGLWGLRAAEMVERLGGQVIAIKKPAGQGFALSEIESALEAHKPSLFFLCHGDSSTGVMQPLDRIGKACRKNGTLFLVDTVASLGGTDIRMDEMEIDAIYSGSQKVLSCPPGLAPLSFGPRAMQKFTDRKTRPVSFYFDIGLVGNYWGCFDEPRRYHHTGPISSVYALREGLGRIAREGLAETVARHNRNADRLRAGLEELGLALFVKDKSYRLATLTTVEVPSDVTDWKAVITFLMKNGVEIAGGLGATTGKIFRIGLFGFNSTEENVSTVLKLLASGLAAARNNSSL